MKDEIKKPDPVWINLQNAAKVADCSERTLMRAHADGNIRLYKRGGRLYAKYKELLEDLENMAEVILPQKEAV